VPPPDAVLRLEAAFVARIGAARFGLWFPPNARFIWLGSELVVAARNAHFQDWAADKFGQALEAAAAEVAGGPVPVRFVTDPELFADADKPASAPPAPTASTVVQTNLFGEETPPQAKARRTRDRGGKSETPGYGHSPGRRWKTFAEFAVGSCNRVAHAAALSAVEEPGLGANPIVIYGPVGTGKTHLLEAVYAGLRNRWPDARPTYVTAEEFTHRAVQAMRFGKTPGLRRQFRECSALLFDDLHFLETRRATQEEFLHTLDALTTDGRQVVVTTDCHPRLAEALMPELADRLLGGAVWGLLPPDDETRLEILKRKAAGGTPALPDEVLKFLARNLKGNVRELEGAVNSLRHFARVTSRTASVALAREALGDLLRHTVRSLSMADLDAAVCAVLRLSAGSLQSKSRSWAVSHPRMLAVYLARKYTAASYGEIAKHFGVRQHSTAMAGEKKVRQWLTEDTVLAFGDRKWSVKDLLARVERELQR
jgi:chromosomal replication initiator protein